MSRPNLEIRKYEPDELNRFYNAIYDVVDYVSPKSACLMDEIYFDQFITKVHEIFDKHNVKIVGVNNRGNG